jgi:hypothetical protein
MSTEYRRGIPSVAHIEAATRLGLLWARTSPLLDREALYRPICTDGTLVDWAVLDAEAARVQAPAAAQPEPRRFADVWPDRHGWRWWRIVGAPDAGIIGARFEAMREQWRWLAMSDGAAPTGNAWNERAAFSMVARTVIPTDEQGNPVSWESIAQPTPTTEAGTQTPNGARPATSSNPCSEFLHHNDTACNTESVRPVPMEESISVSLLPSFQQTLDTVNRAITQVVLGKLEAPVKPEPLPRFTADELDDVDHSQSTKLDSAPLKRGKLPTISQIGKYREVLAKRSGTVTEALKASGIDCEVAQYVLERWAGGLSDKEALWTIIAAEGVGTLASSIDRVTIDERVQQARKTTLDIAEPTDNSAQRQREEREAQRLRMAALQAQLAAERAARTVEPQSEPNRFDLLECDPKADPAVSIAAWEARQKRSTVRLMPKPQPQPQPLPAPCRLFEVVDAEAEGLRPGAVFTALLGRALNPNC